MKVLGREASIGRYKPLGIFPPQRRQRGSLPYFPQEDAILQPQPQQALVTVRLLILSKGREDLCQLRILVVPAHRADDAVPVQLRAAVGVEGLEVRAEAVVPGGVPDDVDRPAFLQLAYFIHDSNNLPCT